MRNSIRLFAVAAFALTVLAVPSVASAQWGIFGGNGGYNQNNGYNRNTRAVVVTLKNRSKEFARRLDRELDRSRYNGGWGEDRLNAMAREFYQAADDLEDNWDNGRNSYQTDNYVRRVVMLGNSLDRELSRARLGWGIESDWSRIRQDLNTLQNSYGSYNRNDNWNRGNRNDRDDWNRGNRNDRDDWNRGNNNGRNDNWNRGNGNGRYEPNGKNDRQDRKKGYPFPF